MRSKKRAWARRLLRVALVIGVLAALLTGGAALWLYAEVRASLPRLDGELSVVGLKHPVELVRDQLGVVTVRARTRDDVARATGFVHAQERFFQMDLMRRQAAGELAELFGPPALAWDREIRVHRFRGVARQVVANLAADERALVEAYAAGVNTGLEALEAAPFEYLLLRTAPRRWAADDTVLCILAMFITLQPSDGAVDSSLGLVHDLLPAQLAAYLTPQGTSWDAPLDAQAVAHAPLPPPPLDVNRRASQPAALAGTEDQRPGSNAWAVSGAHTEHGGALLANDMHLGLRVPNTWFRARFEWTEAGVDRAVTGVTLPGTPAMIVGSNGRVAWGFTNSYGDFSDLVEVELDPRDPERYRSGGEWRLLERNVETIVVKGGEDAAVRVRATEWGPLIDEDHRGTPRALRWTAHDPEAVNLRLVDMERAENLDHALAVAARAGIPGQNLVCADHEGRVGWAVIGRLPQRTGCDGRTPCDESCRWQGWVPAAQQPRLADPVQGRIWTANARVVSGRLLEVVGDGGYALGARARQIRDGLLALERATEHDMLRVQLDDRALFLERWRDLTLELLTPQRVAEDERRAQARELVTSWNGRASVDAAGYRIVRAYRLELLETVVGGLTETCREVDPDFRVWHLGQVEDALWELANERPPHLLPAHFASWEELLLTSFDSTLAELAESCGVLSECRWGVRNRAAVRHPLSGAIPGLAHWLDMPATELPGGSHMPRVQSPSFGASQRMVVSPGREELGLFHMPCGQSGHPLSPYYRAGHEDWERGEASPFLPGETRHRLQLLPTSGS